MLNPLGPHAAGLVYGNPSADQERPVAPAEFAVKVTAASNAAGLGSATTAPQERETPPDTPSSLEKALEDVNNNMKAWATGMRFDVDADANRVVVSIIDSATGEVLRTVPSDAVIRVAKMIVQMQGNAVNTKA